jgi:hypothetical protein
MPATPKVAASGEVDAHAQDLGWRIELHASHGPRRRDAKGNFKQTIVHGGSLLKAAAHA